MKKKKYNYAVLRSAFGDYWVGKTTLKTNNKSIFSSFEEAIENAKSRTDSHTNILELEDESENKCEIIEKDFKKWICS